MCEALEELMRDELEAKKEEGKEEGTREGRILGKGQVNKLVLKLSALGRTDDIVKAASDEAYQNQLFEEFGL